MVGTTQPDPELLRAAVAALGEGITLADASGRIVYSNPAADRILGVSATGEGPHTWAEHYGVFLPGTDTPFPIEKYPLVRAVAGEETNNVLMSVRHPDNPDGAIISATGRPVRKKEDGRVVGAAVVFRDVTALLAAKEGLRSALEDLQESQGQRRELLEFLVHDMKSPLSAILASAHLLRGADMEGEDGQDLEQIIQSTTTLHRMVLDLLDIHVAEGGHLRVVPDSVDLPELLRTIGARARSRGANVTIDCPPGTSVGADEALLVRVVANLVDNSIKYGPAGGKIWLGATRDADGWARICVRDEGPGVPPHLQHLIFERYAQVEREAGRRHENSRGLGLRFCKVAVEAHGGRIWVENAGVRGAMFWVELPGDVKEKAG